MEGWKNYVLGPVDQIHKKNLPITGFDCVFGGNLPVGAGMSSSAAVECGLLTALNEIYNLQLSRIDIALMGQKAEHTFPGVMCGIMDQFANMMGKKDHVILLDTRSLDYKYFPAHFQDYSIILINSKVHHSLASGEYNVRRQQCQEGLRILGKLLNVTSFRDIKPSDVESNRDALNEDVFRRCLYVTQEIERTQKAAKHLEQDEVLEFGKLMFETHEGLSKLYDVSCEELDFLVEQAKQEPSIIGSRLMGGGFGGCTINLIKKSEWQQVTKEIVAVYKKQFDIDAEVYEVATGDGTYEVQPGELQNEPL
jgi:galactokinase